MTAKVVGARRLRTLSQLAANALIQRSTSGASASAAATLAKNADDVPFALLYLVDGERCTLQQTVGLPDETALNQLWVTLDGEPAMIENSTFIEEVGRLLLRESGTEPLVRVMAEAEDATLVDRVVDHLCETIRRVAVAA